jgi:hypothetical protein
VNKEGEKKKERRKVESIYGERKKEKKFWFKQNQEIVNKLIFIWSCYVFIIIGGEI